MPVCIEVWGDYACFTRPEMKSERVSYDVMTPSAARGILDAIYWHPGLKWHIDRIHVCSPIRFTNIRRNEVSEVVNAGSVKRAMTKGDKDLYLATPECIQQRAALVLKDVRYVIEAHFEVTHKASPSDNPGKFMDIMNRRLESGQYYHQPCMGVRDFPAYFQPCKEIPACPEELKGEKDLGWMLLDMDYSNQQNITPMFFRATMKDGVIEVPSIHNREEVVR